MTASTEILRAMSPRCLEFGEFRLEPATRRLLRSGDPVRLTPRAFDLLLALLENHHRVMTKEELLRRVWSDAVVEESNLTQHVFLLRKLLGDSQDDPRFIATIARRGYRFIGEVREAGPSAVVSRFPAAAVPASRWRQGAAVAVLAAVALGGVALARVLSRPQAPAPPRFRPLTFRGQGVGRARFTADGQTVVLDAAWDGQPSQLFVTPAGEPALRALGVSRAQVVRVSARGEVAVLLNDGSSRNGLTVAKVPLDGGGPRKVLEGVQNADWAPDTDQIAVVRRTNGRTQIEYPAGRRLYETPARVDVLKISPGRDRVAFLEHPILGDTRGWVSVLDLDGEKRVLTREWGAVYGLVWTPAGDEIWFGRFDNRAYAVAAVDLGGRERDVYHGPDGVIVHDLARDGRALASRFTFRSGTVWHPAGAASERVLALFSITRPGAVSRDGNTLLFTAEDQGPEWATYAVYLQTASGAAPIRLGEGSAQGLSPDGRTALAISFSRPAHLVLLPTGAGPARDVPPGPIEQFHKAQWLPDGERVVFAGNEKEKGVRLYVQAVAGGVPKPITPEGFSLDPDGVSPDGRVVVCLPEGGPPALCPIDGSAMSPLPGVEISDKVVRWSDDGRTVYVYKRDALPLRIYGVDVRTGARSLWKEIEKVEPPSTSNVPQLFMTADGRAYAYGSVTLTNDLFVVEGLR